MKNPLENKVKGNKMALSMKDAIIRVLKVQANGKCWDPDLFFPIATK
jgi:hypothetical protein